MKTPLLPSVTSCGFLLMLLLPLVAEASGPRVRVLFATGSGKNNPQIKSFYQKVADNLKKKIFLRHVTEKEHPSRAGWIWLNRKDLTKSHPQANLSHSMPQNRGGPLAGQMIRAVQAQLEKKALEEAIILDCKPEKQSTSACGLYLYERGKARITASTTRRFSVSIKNPAAWASPMVRHFVQGLNTLDERKIGKAIRRLSSLKQSEDSPAPETLLGVSGSINFRAPGSNGIPTGGVSLQTGNKARKWSLEVGGYQTLDASKAGRLREDGAYLGTGITGSSDQIHGLIWDLGLSLGLWQNQRRTRQNSARMRSVTLKAFPALRVPLTSAQQISFRFETVWRATVQYKGEEHLLALPGRFHSIMFSYYLVI